MNETTYAHTSCTSTVADADPSKRELCRDVRDRAAAQVYDAECVLHSARQSEVDGWITAASDKLHLAILNLAAAEALAAALPAATAA